MFNPIDGALFASGTVISTGLGIATGVPHVISAVAAATVTGIFVLLAKYIELRWRTRLDSDKRVQVLEQQLRDAGLTPKQ